MSCLPFMVVCLLSHTIPDSLPVIVASHGSQDFSLSLHNDLFRTRYGEPWLISASPSMPCSCCDAFQPDRLFDGDLATAWVSAAEDLQEPAYICVQAPLPPGPESERYFCFLDSYGDEERIDMSLFCVGSLIIWNGWQASTETWRDYGRIKRILVWNNDRMYCVVDLQDTMDPQLVDIIRLVIQNPSRWQMTISWGDSLRFEIIDVYPGDVHQNIGLSEILIVWSAG